MVESACFRRLEVVSGELSFTMLGIGGDLELPKRHIKDRLNNFWVFRVRLSLFLLCYFV